MAANHSVVTAPPSLSVLSVQGQTSRLVTMEDAPDWDDLLEDVMHQEEEEDPMRMDDDEYPDFNEDEYQAPVSTVQPPSTMEPIPDSREPVATEEPDIDDYEDDPPMSSPPRSPTFTPTERRPVRPSARKDVFSFER